MPGSSIFSRATVTSTVDYCCTAAAPDVVLAVVVVVVVVLAAVVVVVVVVVLGVCVRGRGYLNGRPRLNTTPC